MDGNTENDMIRLLRAEEIECRVASINEKGVTLLLYKDARVDQRILDETFGIMGWKRSHQCIDGNLYCTVEVYDSRKGEWVSKQDVGIAAYTEKEKSQASDSFKRACFNWGIGRELYSAPFIWIPAARANIQKKGDKFYCNGSFSVQTIGYSSDREIAELTVINEKGQAVYELKAKDMKPKGAEPEKLEKQGKAAISSSQMDSLEAELQRTGVKMEAVMGRYNISSPGQISEEVYSKIMKALEKTKTAA